MPRSSDMIYIALLALLLPILADAQSFFVSPDGNNLNPGTELSPWNTIQHACDNATPGSTVFIKGGIYNEKVSMNVSGSAGAGFITFRNFENDAVILDGTGITGDQLILIENRSYIRIAGVELRNNLNQSFGTGIWIQGSGDHIEIRDNRIHDMRARAGGDAMAISVYGTHASIPLSNIVIDNNLIYNCEPGHSEALTLNGNVDTFEVTRNVIHDVNNIGIDMIGGEKTCPTLALDAARNGLCAWNEVTRARSSYGGGYAAGIYVDGGRNIIIENNTVTQCDGGMEIGAENKGLVSSNIIVRNNLLYNNDKWGLGFGGYDYPRTGKVTNSKFLNNTAFSNDVLGVGFGELWIQYAEGCSVQNNIFSASSQNRLMTTTVGTATGNVLDYNLWHAPGGISNASVDWAGEVYGSFSDYRTGTAQESHSLFAIPLFATTAFPSPDLHLSLSSPARDAGNPDFMPGASEVDIDSQARVILDRVDIGADEYYVSPLPGVPALLSVYGENPLLPQFTWRRSENTTHYHIQVSTSASFSDFAVDDSTLTDTAYQITGELFADTKYYWRVRAIGEEGISAWSQVWTFSTAAGSFSFDVLNRWNLLSLPLLPDNPLKNAIFPTASSSVFAFVDEMYAGADTLRPGVAYWVKFDGAQNIRLSGAPVTSDTISLVEGWNLVGSIATPLAVAGIVREPAEMVLSYFFGYNGTYFISDTLEPAHGYWVKADRNGVLIVTSEGMR